MMSAKTFRPAFARFESTSPDEKVKGSVIGIDLGKLQSQSLHHPGRSC